MCFQVYECVKCVLYCLELNKAESCKDLLPQFGASVCALLTVTLPPGWWWCVVVGAVPQVWLQVAGSCCWTGH